jgi:uncharacterized protein YegJ (DUF2314 family)
MTVMHRVAIMLFAVATAVLPANAQSARDMAKEGLTFQVPADDPDMAVAMRKARTTLPHFLSLAQNPKSSMKNFGVKVAVPADAGYEFFWIRPFENNGTEFSGRLRNTPRAAKNLKINDVVSFPQDNIVDWTYLDDGKMMGNFTACALLKKESKASADAFKRQYGLECDP